jgi:prophage regulatory protein
MPKKPVSTPPERLVRRPEVLHRISTSKSSLDRMVRDGRFPAPRKLSARSVAWLESEVSAWIAQLASRSTTSVEVSR